MSPSLLTIEGRSGRTTLRREAGRPDLWRRTDVAGPAARLIDILRELDDRHLEAELMVRDLRADHGRMLMLVPHPVVGRRAPLRGELSYPVDFTVIALMDELSNGPSEAPILCSPAAGIAETLGSGGSRRALRGILARHNALAVDRQPWDVEDFGLDGILARADLAGPWHVDIRTDRRPTLRRDGSFGSSETDSAELYAKDGRFVAALWRHGEEDEDGRLSSAFAEAMERLATLSSPRRTLAHNPVVAATLSDPAPRPTTRH